MPDRLGETLAAELRATAQRHPEVAAIHFHGRDYTYAEWDAAADRFARGLLAAGIGRGDRVVLLLPSVPQPGLPCSESLSSANSSVLGCLLVGVKETCGSGHVQL